jgi:hypothetical protein
VTAGREPPLNPFGETDCCGPLATLRARMGRTLWKSWLSACGNRIPSDLYKFTGESVAVETGSLIGGSHH